MDLQLVIDLQFQPDDNIEVIKITLEMKKMNFSIYTRGIFLYSYNWVVSYGCTISKHHLKGLASVYQLV